MTGDKSAATSRPMVTAIAAVTTSHQNVNPRSLPIVAMKTDLIKRTGELIFPRSQSTARGSKNLMTERAESLARARTWPAALESLVRSQRNGANDPGRLGPSSFFRVRSSRPVTREVPGRISLLVFDVALRSSTACAAAPVRSLTGCLPRRSPHAQLRLLTRPERHKRHPRRLFTTLGPGRAADGPSWARTSSPASRCPGGQAQVPHGHPHSACRARIGGTPAVRHRGRDARRRYGGPGPAHGRPAPASRLTAPRRCPRTGRSARSQHADPQPN